MSIATCMSVSSRILMGIALMPALMSAQRQEAREGPRRVRNPVAPLIDARRELDLSSRQLVQLDSIERHLLQQNREVAATMRARTDSMVRGKNPRDLSSEERQALREKLQALRPMRDQMFRNDSVARVRAFALLDSAQKSQASRFMRREARENVAMRRMDGMSARNMRGAGRDHRGMRDMRRMRMRERMRDFRDRDGFSRRLREREFRGGMGRRYGGEFDRRRGEDFRGFRDRDLDRRFRDDRRSESSDSTEHGDRRRFRDDSTRARTDSLDRRGTRRQRSRVPSVEAPGDTIPPSF